MKRTTVPSALVSLAAVLCLIASAPAQAATGSLVTQELDANSIPLGTQTSAFLGGPATCVHVPHLTGETHFRVVNLTSKPASVYHSPDCSGTPFGLVLTGGSGLFSDTLPAGESVRVPGGF
ncbi:hypothetical protein ACQKM2_26625 [Streptomyces sp. NPDC004126]|uniref:hypothetical protein n=1 Tax=Streptomyces sp. NPDC004126 TaxID=3390695 RepID=UPI003D02D88A